MLNYNDYQLRSLQPNDLAQVLSWRNSDRIRKFTFTDHIITWDEHLAWFSRISTDIMPSVMLLEYLHKPIGTLALSDIDSRNNKCFWAIYLGETDVPKGSGTALGLLGLEYIFEKRKIRKLCAEVFGFNEPSLNFHKRIGFIQEGTLQEHILKHEKYEDVVVFRYLTDDWIRNKPTLYEANFSGWVA